MTGRVTDRREGYRESVATKRRRRFAIIRDDERASSEGRMTLQRLREDALPGLLSSDNATLSESKLASRY